MSLGTFFFSKDMVTGSKFSYWVTIFNIFAMELREIITYGGYFERFFDGLCELWIELALTLKRCYYEDKNGRE